MTNKQVKAAVRRIPFNPAVALPLPIQVGLTRIVAKQLRRLSCTDRFQRRAHLQIELGLLEVA